MYRINPPIKNIILSEDDPLNIHLNKGVKKFKRYKIKVKLFLFVYRNRATRLAKHQTFYDRLKTFD